MEPRHQGAGGEQDELVDLYTDSTIRSSKVHKNVGWSGMVKLELSCCDFRRDEADADSLELMNAFLSVRIEARRVDHHDDVGRAEEDNSLSLSFVGLYEI